MGLRVKPWHEEMLSELLDAGPGGIAAVVLVGRGLTLHGLDAHGLVEQFTDPSRVLTDRWRLTHAGAVFARFLTGRRDAA
jgi:hypothetical protein